MASQVISTSSETTSDQPFIFTPISAPSEDIFGDKNTTELLTKWGLIHGIFKYTFSFDRPCKEYQSEKIVRDFFNDSNNNIYFKSTELGVDPLNITPIACTVTCMEFFDKLYVDTEVGGVGLVKKSGHICGCYEETFHGMYVSDELRKMFLSDESEYFDLFSESEANEFIYNLLKLVCLGGSLNQYEDTLQPYLDVVLQLYRDLISVVKEPKSENIRTNSLVYSVTGHKQGQLVFPSTHPHPQNVCYAIIDPAKRHLTLFYHIWK